MFFGFLLVSTLLCTLVAGFVFTYAIVVMPGFGKLNDREFIQAFQATDGIIQNNQPLFMFVWVGSIASVAANFDTWQVAGSTPADNCCLGNVIFKS